MKISNYIICDDIRFERDNKISLMGVYEDVISFNVDSSKKGKWPKHFSFALLLNIQIEDKDIEAGTKALEITFEVNDKEQKLARITIKSAPLQNRGKIRIMPKINNYPILSEGNLIVKVRSLNKDGQEIERLETPTIEIIESVIDNLKSTEAKSK